MGEVGYSSRDSTDLHARGVQITVYKIALVAQEDGVFGGVKDFWRSFCTYTSKVWHRMRCDSAACAKYAPVLRPILCFSRSNRIKSKGSRKKDTQPSRTRHIFKCARILAVLVIIYRYTSIHTPSARGVIACIVLPRPWESSARRFGSLCNQRIRRI